MGGATDPAAIPYPAHQSPLKPPHDFKAFVGSTKPVVILDFGKQSVGGYAVFTVTAKTGQPVVRLSYACHPDGLSETGCFSRETSARYLGPTLDLPVLPGNVNRHETYTIPRTGHFIAPLIQGQARYVRLQLDSPYMNILLWAVFADAAKIAERLDHKDDSVAAQKKSEVIKHAIYAHNWMNLVEPGWKGATTTTECMGMGTRGWGDESHPDTAIAYLFSA
jgi:hypothetical protein